MTAPESISAALATVGISFESEGVTCREEGEANQYSILSEKKWIALILQNGEFGVTRQRANMALFMAAPALRDEVIALRAEVVRLKAFLKTVGWEMPA